MNTMTTTVGTREKDAVNRSRIVPRGRMTEPFTLVMCGASSDLAARKLFPAAFVLARGSVI